MGCWEGKSFVSIREEYPQLYTAREATTPSSSRRESTSDPLLPAWNGR